MFLPVRIKFVSTISRNQPAPLDRPTKTRSWLAATRNGSPPPLPSCGRALGGSQVCRHPRPDKPGPRVPGGTDKDKDTMMPRCFLLTGSLAVKLKFSESPAQSPSPAGDLKCHIMPVTQSLSQDIQVATQCDWLGGSHCNSCLIGPARPGRTQAYCTGRPQRPAFKLPGPPAVRL